MHAIMITFDLVDMTPERYAQVSAELAPSFAALPGLLTKLWLSDVDRNPHFGDLNVQRFAVDETTTALTQPGITVVPAPVTT